MTAPRERRIRRWQQRLGARQALLRAVGEAGKKPADASGSAQAATPGAVAAMLRAHGIAERAIQSLLSVGESLRVRSVASGDEWAAMFSSRTGHRLGKNLRGEPNKVNITPHLNALVLGHPYVQLHTHPSRPSPAFSAIDAFNVVGVADIHAVVVVGGDEVWYVLSRAQSFVVPQGDRAIQGRLHAVYVAFENAIDHLKPTFDRRVEYGELDEGEARRQITHEVWQVIAAGLQLRYDRVAASQGTDDELQGNGK
jgi:hypothetical protein